MKLAYLSTDRGLPVFGRKGGSIHIQELVNALSSLDNEITVLAARRGPMSNRINAEVLIVGDELSPLPTGSHSNGGESETLVKEEYSLRVGSAIQKRLEKIYAEKGVDLIYERYSLWSAAGVRAAQELNIPCVVEVNAPLLEEERKYRTLVQASKAEAIEKEVFSGAHLLLAVSEEVKAYVVAKGGDPNRTFVIPNGVDTKRFHPAVEPDPVLGTEGKFVVGFTGSLKAWHGIEVLLDAFRALAHRSPDYHLLLVGDGPFKNWVEGYIQGANLEGRATVTGWVSHEKIPGLIQRMDVAVAPYPFLEDFYFSPLKLFEYMAIGKPVVGSRIGQVEEVIQDGTTGLLVKPGDPNDLVEKIESLRCQKGVLETLGAAASREMAGYTWENNARRVMSLVGQLGEKE